MNKYEYKTIKIESKGFFNTNIQNDKRLNELGESGCKLITAVAEQFKGDTTAFYYTFMREKQ
ncbi:DUF4177 domain-containing protein [Bacillus ginsengihumi]|uniref:DUF4177 domain-containing protein n=1 Tax=Heyndrickxia ginsengihumi TaxID=363870 RepID=A0A6M0PBV4_9BACI|nr:DUF4177 domain-containing protein [Heyndrickxia ginsengihumi]MCM3024670.1 DUF4177 domain-containing protein [Heyndrickxia ginsengihumi]NEY21639.1 DUF4177 domain-containing protein [Heyndrickxia ginsengihumi]